MLGFLRVRGLKNVRKCWFRTFTYLYTIFIINLSLAELREESVEVLLSTASLLQLHSVTKACCAFLRKQLDPCNCLGIALFAELQSCLTLHKSALEYTYQHFMQVYEYVTVILFF